jgi:hypothetical protein
MVNREMNWAGGSTQLNVLTKGVGRFDISEIRLARCLIRSNRSAKWGHSSPPWVRADGRAPGQCG